MRKKQILSLFFFSVIAVSLFAEDVPWRILNAPLGETDLMNQSIVELMSQDFYPVGFEVAEEGIVTILFQEQELSATKFYLYYFEDTATLNTDFTAFMQQGWMPVDIAFFGKGMFGLFIDTEEPIKSWRLLSIDGETVDERLEFLNAQTRAMHESGLVPFGLSNFQGNLMVGYIQSPKLQDDNFIGLYSLLGYPDDGVSFLEGVNLHIGQGYTITGLHVSEGVVYLGFLQ